MGSHSGSSMFPIPLGDRSRPCCAGRAGACTGLPVPVGACPPAFVRRTRLRLGARPPWARKRASDAALPGPTLWTLCMVHFLVGCLPFSMRLKTACWLPLIPLQGSARPCMRCMLLHPHLPQKYIAAGVSTNLATCSLCLSCSLWLRAMLSALVIARQAVFRS